ncbi:hypothetical protein ACAG24_023370 [Mycobacterium sp. pW049]
MLGEEEHDADGLTFSWLANPDGPPPEKVLDLAFRLLRNASHG